MSELEISVRTASGNKEVSVVTLKGAIDGYTLVKFDEGLNKLLNANRYKLIIDCKGLTFISSAGVGLLMDAHDRVNLLQGDIKLINVTPQACEIIELLGFSDIFRNLMSDERQALEEFGEELRKHLKGKED